MVAMGSSNRKRERLLPMPVWIGVLAVVGAVVIQLTRDSGAPSAPNLAAGLFTFLQDWAIILSGGVIILIAVAAFTAIRETRSHRSQESGNDASEEILEPVLVWTGVLVVVGAMVVQLTRGSGAPSTPNLSAWLFAFLQDWAIILSGGVTILIGVAAFMAVRETRSYQSQESRKDLSEAVQEWCEDFVEFLHAAEQEPDKAAWITDHVVDFAKVALALSNLRTRASRVASELDETFQEIGSDISLVLKARDDEHAIEAIVDATFAARDLSRKASLIG